MNTELTAFIRSRTFVLPSMTWIVTVTFSTEVLTPPRLVVNCLHVWAIAIVLWFAIGFTQVYAASIQFTATYRYAHEPSATLIDASNIYVGDAGLRVDHTIDDSGNSLIANFDTNQLWFVNFRRAVVHEVPVTDISGAVSPGVQDTDTPDFGFIQFAPCQGMQAKQIIEPKMSNQYLQRRRCRVDSSEWIQEQLFSSSLGVVVWSRDVDGFVSEVLDIREQATDPDRFKPPSHFRAVELRELIQGSSSIDVYQEPD